MTEETVALETQDDIALADRLKTAHANITQEMGKLIIEIGLHQGNSILQTVPGDVPLREVKYPGILLKQHDL